MKTILQIAEEEGLLPGGELPKYPVEKFVDYQELVEALERFAARIRAEQKEKDVEISKSTVDRHDVHCACADAIRNSKV